MTAHIVLGVNGSGKTTYFKHILNEKLQDKEVVFINADEIKIDLVKKGMNSEAAKVKSGQIAISKISECIRNKKSFSLETTFTDDGAMGSIAIIKELKKSGYEIKGYNVYTNDINLNIERVSNRFLKGIGHFVPEEIIRYRYEKYINNLLENKDLFDTLNFYNNTDFNFKESDFLDFSNTSRVREKIIESLLYKIKEINPNYNILDINELNSKFTKRIDNKDELMNKYSQFLELELKKIKEDIKSNNKENTIENYHSLEL